MTEGSPQPKPKLTIPQELGLRYASVWTADIGAIGVTAASAAVFNAVAGEKGRNYLGEKVAKHIVEPLLDKGEAVADWGMKKALEMRRGNISLEEKETQRQAYLQKMENWRKLSPKDRAKKVADVIVDVSVTLVPAMVTRVLMQEALDKKFKVNIDNGVDLSDKPFKTRAIAQAKSWTKIGLMQIPDRVTAGVSLVGVHMFAPEVEKTSTHFFAKLFKIAGQGEASALANGALTYVHMMSGVTGNFANAVGMTWLNRHEAQKNASQQQGRGGGSI